MRNGVSHSDQLRCTMRFLLSSNRNSFAGMIHQINKIVPFCQIAVKLYRTSAIEDLLASNSSYPHMMELSDLIRLNQLVRGSISFAGFERWFDESSTSGQRTIIHTLSELAHQAGVNDDVFASAVRCADLSPDDSTVEHIRSLRQHDGMTTLRIYKWIESAPDTELRSHLRFFVSLFGTAEGRVFSKERAEWCNHWWHRDLLDDRVVQELLNDPRFYMTSMKDDARIKTVG